MSLLLAGLISLFVGWTVAAADALFRDEKRPPVFSGTLGTTFLLILTGVGGLFAAGDILWIFQAIRSSVVIVIIGGGGYLGYSASNRLQVNAAGAANRLIVGLAGLMVFYVIGWELLRPTVDF